MVRRKTHEEFIREIKEKYGDEYTVLGKYINANTKILIRHNCKECNFHEWHITPYSLLRDHSCPKCANNKRRRTLGKTHEEFVKEIRQKYNGEYEILGKYISNRVKILVKHKCGYEWNIRPYSLLNGNGCPICGNKRRIQKQTKTHEKFIRDVDVKYNGEYEILGKYTNARTKIKIKHNSKKCNYYEWETMPNALLNGNGCPLCAGKEIKLGINTIWDTDKWMVDLGISEEDAKKYTHSSSKTITVKCPDCGREKKIQISNIYQNKSISCSCGDGKSYPEKFVFNLLEQLDVEFETEYSPKWIKPKRYDFHIDNLNIIIETHGGQHYDRGFERAGGKTLKQEQINDKFKRETALKNGIKHYIELDCRKSNLEWIKNSILNSELNELFDLSKIDWNKCAEFSNKNIVKEVCKYWSNKRADETTSDLMKEFNLGRFAIIKYLKKGNKLGWCKYDGKEEMIKIVSKKGKNGKEVEVFERNKSLGIFNSSSELERKSEELFGIRLTQVGISRVCRGERKQYKGFTFKYVEEDNNSNILKIA